MGRSEGTHAAQFCGGRNYEGKALVEHSYTYNEGLYYHSERQEMHQVGALGVLSCVFIASESWRSNIIIHINEAQIVNYCKLI